MHSVYDYKISAGASHLVSRSRASFRLPAPTILVTNVAVPSVSSGSSSLYMLPDRVLVKTGRRWSDVAYRDLRIVAEQRRFIEEEAPPRDSQQVGTTWRYVNVKGGPNRRFKDNRQLPVMLYRRIALTSGHGLQWILDLSQPQVAEWFAAIIGSRPPTQSG